MTCSHRPRSTCARIQPLAVLRVAAGFILDRLPIFRILGAFLRLFLMAFKPAILIYGATKLYQATKEEV